MFITRAHRHTKRTKGIPHNGIGLTLFFFFYASLSRHVSAPVHAYRLSSFSPLLLFFLNRIFIYIYIYNVFFSFLLSKLRFVLSRLAIGVSRTKKIDLMGSLLFLVSGFVEFNDVETGYRGSWNTAPFFGCVLFSVSSYFFFFFLHFYSCHSRIRQPRRFKKKKGTNVGQRRRNETTKGKQLNKWKILRAAAEASQDVRRRERAADGVVGRETEFPPRRDPQFCPSPSLPFFPSLLSGC